MRLKQDHWFVLAILFLCLGSYANTFSNPFVWDDYDFIVGRENITELSSLPYFFSNPTLGNLYRPLRESLYIITYAVWGLNPIGYHLNALILHIAASLLVFLIIRQFAPNTLAGVAALFFAVHPLHTERVTNMTAGFDLLGIVLYLLAFYCFILWRKKEKQAFFWGSLTVYILALLASEEAITFIGVCLLYDLCFHAEFYKEKIKLAKQYIYYGFATLVYLVIRTGVVGQVGRANAYLGDSIQVALLSTVKALAGYGWLLIYPVHLSIYRAVPKEESITSISLLLSFVLLLAILLIWYKSYTKSKLVFFSLGWFFVTMFLFYNIIPKPTLMADRYLYLPSLGFCLLLTLGIRKVSLFSKQYSKHLFWIISILIMVIYVGLTINRNADWSSRESILAKAVEVQPLSSQANWALGAYYREVGSREKAEHYLLEAVKLSTQNYLAYSELGVLYAEQGNLETSASFFRQAINAFPEAEGEYYKGYNDLGLVYAGLEDYNAAVSALQKAVSIHPEFVKAHHDLATVYAKAGQWDKAEEEFQIVLSLQPSNSEYQANYAVFRKVKEDAAS